MGSHGALFDLAAAWGVGGLLVDLEQLTVQHGALPRVADGLRVALAMFAAAYAPTGSAREAQAWRPTPCTLCELEVPRG